MGCANCANNVPSAGLVVINDDAKTPSIDKVHFPSLNTNSTTDEIYFPVDNTQLRFSFPDVFPSTAMLKQSNTARTEPLKYISTIEKYKMNIKTKNERALLSLYK